MDDISFHTVDPQSLQLPVEAIVAPHNGAIEGAIYDIPVPTTDQTLPHAVPSGRTNYRIVDDRLHRSKPNLIDQYRGRIGGC